jgi:SAM-dependent methyltransferase
VSPCPLCGGPTDAAFAVTDRNRAITRRSFPYRRCRACASYFLADVPADLGRYYPAEYYELPDAAALDDLAAGEWPKLELLAPAGGHGRLVEIGAGFGVFARAARGAGYAVTAIEMDRRCCAYLESVVGVEAIESDRPQEALATLPPSRAIALWHALEHLPDPWAVLAAAAANLESGGVLAVAVPNPQALQFRLLRGRWAHVDAPRHLYLIPAATLTRQAAALGLERLALTTSDLAGRHWNRFGWEYALRRFPARRPATRGLVVASQVLERALRPLERRGLAGTAYSAVFEKRA